MKPFFFISFPGKKNNPELAQPAVNLFGRDRDFILWFYIMKIGLNKDYFITSI